MVRRVEKADVNTFESSLYKFEFKGSGSEFFKIWLVNILLTIITLGIYSAWAKVRTQRYFYGNTRLNDSSFEYLASPWQILKGRIIAVIFFILYSYLSSLSPIFGVILLTLFLAVMPYIVVLAIRFQHRVSAYKNIHFNFKGSEKEAAMVYLLWPLLSVLTLGLLYPFSHQRFVHFYITNSTYGNITFKNESLVSDFYKLYLFIFVIVIGLLGIAILLPITILDISAELNLNPTDPSFLPMLISVYTMLFFVYFLFYAFIKSRITNLIMNTTSLDDYIFFKSDLSLRSMIFLLFTNMVAIVFTLGLAYPWAKVRLAKYRAEHTILQASGSLDDFIGSHVDTSNALGEEMSEVFDIDVGL